MLMRAEGFAYTKGAMKVGTLDDPSVFGGAQTAIFTAEDQPFHLIADGVPAFEGLPPRREKSLDRH